MSTNTLDRLTGTTSRASNRVKSATGVKVIPYDASLDTMADKFLPWFWERLKADGLVELYFPGASETGFADFVKLMSSRDTRILLVTTKDESDQPEKFVGFASWQPMPFGQALAGIAGFIFLKEFWGSGTSVVAAEEIMRYWFEKAKLDVMLGVIAERNKLANGFMERVGWTRMGAVPLLHVYQNEQCPAVFWYITKDEFKARGGC